MEVRVDAWQRAEGTLRENFLATSNEARITVRCEHAPRRVEAAHQWRHDLFRDALELLDLVLHRPYQGATEASFTGSECIPGERREVVGSRTSRNRLRRRRDRRCALKGPTGTVVVVYARP